MYIRLRSACGHHTESNKLREFAQLSQYKDVRRSCERTMTGMR